MDIERIQARIRPRAPWRAMDLGARLMRAWWGRLTLTWLLTTLVPFALLIAAFGMDRIYTACLVFWWLKPLWEKPLLEYLSRALFGERPGAAQLLREFPRYGFRGLAGLLTWRRFAPSRSFDLPVIQLERNRGTRLANRLRVLHLPPSNRSSMLTLVMVNMEQGLLLGFLLLIYMLVPWQFNLQLREWLIAPNPGQQLITAVSWYLAMTLTEPLYVACGFALYLNKRTWLEAWDIDLGLRRIGLRRGAGAMAAGFLLCLTLPLVAGHARADTATKATPKQQAIHILAGPDFMPLQTHHGWRPRSFVHEPDWLKKLLTLLPHLHHRSSATDWSTLAGALRFMLWVVVISLALWLLWHYRRWLAALARRQGPERAPPSVAGLDIRPESLPPDTGSAVRDALAAGRTREALSLLYRASLSRLVSREGLALTRGATEGECLRAIREYERADRWLPLMEPLTRLWVTAAWAHRVPPEPEIMACLEQWQRLQDGGEASHA